MSDTHANNPLSAGLGQDLCSDQVLTELLESCAPHQRAILNVLAVADHFDLDAAPLVASLACELPRAYRYQTIELSEQLGNHVEPVDALGQIPGLLPPSCVLAMRLARKDGTLPALYAALVERDPDPELQASADDDSSLSKIAGLLVRSFLVASLLIFIMLKIVPEFEKMFEEFGIEFPSSMRLLITLLDSAAKFWFVPAIIMLIAIPFCIPVFRRYLQVWNPFLWRQRRYSPSVNRQRSLALITETGLPASTGIEMMSESQHRPSAAKRLNNVNERMKDGQDEWTALATEKIISQRDASALRLSADSETQAWLLRWSAINRQHRQESRAVFLTRVIIGLFNIAIALLVALTCISVFMTLIQIISSM